MGLRKEIEGHAQVPCQELAFKPEKGALDLVIEGLGDLGIANLGI
jgi:hypothetical protein